MLSIWKGLGGGLRDCLRNDIVDSGMITAVAICEP
jgi:hypothetical protein